VTKATDEAQPVAAQKPLPLDYQSSDARRAWQVGTLTYTFAGLVVLFIWLLLGDFAISLRDRSVGTVIKTVLKHFQASDTAISVTISFIPPGIAMILGPIVSYKSDRYRSRWGRRIPFLLIPTPFAVLAMIGLAFWPEIAAWLHNALGAHSPGSKHCLLIVFAIFWTCFEIVVVTAMPIFNGLINDVVPRPVMGRFYSLFRAVSLIDGMIFNWFIVEYSVTHFRWIFIGLSVVFGVGFVLMCLNVKEGEYPPPTAAPKSRPCAHGGCKQQIEPGARFCPHCGREVPMALVADIRAAGFIDAVKIYFRECFSKPHYLWVFAALMLGSVTFIPINLFAPIYGTSVGMSLKTYGQWIAYTYICSLLLAYPLGWLVDAIHCLRLSIICMGLYAVAVLLGSALIYGPQSFAWALLAHGVISGMYFTSAASMSQALLPRMKFGQFSSASTLLTSVCTMLLSLVIGLILDASGHNYRLTYVGSGVLAVVAVFVLLIVYRRFMQLGGPGRYVAPEEGVFFDCNVTVTVIYLLSCMRKASALVNLRIERD
jgi:MFS family permease